MTSRCAWAGSDPLYVAYHDDEWGVPLFDDARLFELLLLEGAQAGLSWITVLRRREGYRAAFDGFDAERIARYDDAKVAALLADPRIIRNRAKVAAAIGNARAYLDLRERSGSFAAYLWRHVEGRPVRNTWRSLAEIPPSTPASTAMSKDLSKLGFKFVGPTICYALMQSAGMVNDHVVDCFRHAEVAALAEELR